MVNSEMGDEYVIDMILHGVSFAEKRVADDHGFRLTRFDGTHHRLADLAGRRKIRIRLSGCGFLVKECSEKECNDLPAM